MVICTGSLALDTTRTPFKTVERVLGGSASYFAYSASFFTRVGVVSAVGNDFPKEHWKLLEKKGVNLSGVQVLDGKTFFFDSSFSYDLHKRTANATELNVFADFIPRVPVGMQNEEIVYLGTLSPVNQDALLDQLPRRRMVFMDTIEYYIQNNERELREVIKKVDGLILNDVEARMLSGEHNLVKAGRKLQATGPKIVVIKKGEHGCLLFEGTSVYPFPAFPLEDVVDPTGAGDSFAGGFVGFLAKKNDFSPKTLRQAIAYGIVMGAFAVSDYALDGLKKIKKADISRRVHEYKKLIEFWFFLKQVF